MRNHVQTLVVGAGIVGVSAAWELAKAGSTDILVIDQARLFRTGGSTSHAPGGVFQNNASRTVSRLAQWTVETFNEVSAEGSPTYFPTGSLEIATSEARWADLHRKYGYARSWGLDAQLLDPTETGERIPWLDPSLVLGSIAVARDGIVRSVPTVERIAKRAEALGVEFTGSVELTGVDIQRGVVRAAETTEGRISCDQLLLCGGIWGPLLGRISGTPVPIQPCAHPYVRSAPLRQLAGLEAIVYPVWRHQDHSMYLWQDGDQLGVGNYRHEPHLVSAGDIRKGIDSPAELPFDMQVMEPGIREAERLLPALAGFAIEDRTYGMFSFTPDGQSLIGEVADIRGLWTAMAIWVTHSAGAGRAVAQLMAEGACELDLREVDVNRFASHQTQPGYVHIRGGQQYREVYDIIHPRQQLAHPRGIRRAPWHARQRELGAFFFESNGWERPQWYEANADLPLPESGIARDQWSAREWSPICAAEHLATRQGAGLFDLSTFMRIDISGPDATAALERITCSRIDRPPGRVTYSLLLNARGGIESDVTIARLAEDRFMVMSGSASGPRDFGWFKRMTRDFDRLSLVDATSSWCAIGVWGPNAMALLQSLAGCEIGPDALPPYSGREIAISGIPVYAINMSYAGEDGLELHCSTDYGQALYEAVWNAGSGFGLVAAGGAAMDTLRLEIGYRALGTDLRAEYSPAEAGLSFLVDRRRSTYIGADALQRRPVKRQLVCLTFEDNGVMPLGKEPVLRGEETLGYITSAGFGYSAGCGIALAYLPIEHARAAGRFDYEYFGCRYPAVVAAEAPLPIARERRTGAPASV